MPLTKRQFSDMAERMVRIFFGTCGFFLLPVAIHCKPPEFVALGIRPR